MKIEWLPPTLQFIYLSMVSLENGWACEVLPRDLRFLHLRACDFTRSVRYQSVNLSHLPRNMEELIVDNALILVPLEFHALPQSLRFLFIRTIDWDSRFPTIIDRNTLPNSLRHLHVIRVASWDQQINLHVYGLDNGECDIRQVYDWKNLDKDSAYYADFSADEERVRYIRFRNCTRAHG